MPITGWILALGALLFNLYSKEIKDAACSACESISNVFYRSFVIDRQANPDMAFAVLKYVDEHCQNAAALDLYRGTEERISLKTGKHRLLFNNCTVTVTLDEKTIEISTFSNDFVVLREFVVEIDKRYNKPKSRSLIIFSSDGPEWKMLPARPHQEIKNLTRDMSTFYQHVSRYVSSGNPSSYKALIVGPPAPVKQVWPKKLQ